MQQPPLVAPSAPGGYVAPGAYPAQYQAPPPGVPGAPASYPTQAYVVPPQQQVFAAPGQQTYVVSGQPAVIVQQPFLARFPEV